MPPSSPSRYVPPPHSLPPSLLLIFLPSLPPSLPQYLYTLEFACATLTIGTLGAMSDYWGRKKAVILTSCGALFNICLILLALSFSASSASSSTAATPGVPSSPSSYRAAIICLYVGTLTNRLTGSYGTHLTGVYAYAAGTFAPSLPPSLPPSLLCVGTLTNGLTGSYGTYLTGVYAYAAGTFLSSLPSSLPPSLFPSLPPSVGPLAFY